MNFTKVVSTNIKPSSVRFFSQTSRVLKKSFYIAIVGTGPASFYTAHHLLNKSSPSIKLNIDFFERLPAPYGLSRYGVAPDHPEVKNCEEYLDNIMKDFDGTNDHKVRFFGNVNIGKDISLKDLESRYHSIVLSYGCTSADNRISIPGAELPGVVSARQFVHWYNGHPDFYTKENKFVPPPLDKIEDVTIIGNGNVALDVARVLLADPTSHWSSTDISTEALNVLKKSKVKNVNIVARRGLLESAFSNKEFRELLELSKTQNIQFIPIADEIIKQVNTKSLGRIEKRRISLIEKYSKQSKDSDEFTKYWSLKYLMSPVEFVQNPLYPELLSATNVRKNELINDQLTKQTKIRPTDEIETIKNELVILSIGYKGAPLHGFAEVNILFENNKLLNRDGRILSTESKGKDQHNAVFKKGWYTSGWIKNGPKGVIATTMMDSFDTADKILEDLSNGIHTDPKSTKCLIENIKNKKVVHWENWLNLNKVEIGNGEKLGKSRDKICDADEMVEIACK